MTTALVTAGPERARIGPWHGNTRVGCITPQPGAPPLSARAVERCIDQLRRLGFREAITTALTVHESAGFFGAGFEVSERLHLLERSIGPRDRHGLRLPGVVALRRGRPSDLDAVLAVDSSSFGDFWRLDRLGVLDARRATTHSRFRVAVTADAVVGYAVTGRQGRIGYLQRLAVDPGRRRGGVGTVLVGDALHWLARWRANSVLVNTQESNSTALALYEGLEFRRKPEGLHVLSASLS